MTQPTEWICDTCAEPVKDPTMSLVVWRHDDDRGDRDFKLVHKGACDPDPEGREYMASLDLKVFLGDDGLAMLLSWLADGPLHGAGRRGSRIAPEALYGFVDLVRRVQTPGYEQARARFRDQDVQHVLAGANEYLPYLPSTLERINAGTLG